MGVIHYRKNIYYGWGVIIWSQVKSVLWRYTGLVSGVIHSHGGSYNNLFT